jgi:predicted glycoside hydrolase/deacetylase ChbG (UPF0249 family)
MTRDGKHLIVNADDFGQSPGINAGIATAHEEGIVTSASLMVRWPAASDAGRYASERPELGLGLHLDLGEWAFRDGEWIAIYEVVPLDDPDAVAAEVASQLEAFHQLVGRKPSHIDSHQHVHVREPVRAPTLDLARRLEVPVRSCTPGIEFCGDFYGQSEDGTPLPGVVSVGGLRRIVAGIGPGVTELSCHPGIAHDLDTMYREPRAREVSVLCHPDVLAEIRACGIELRSFSTLPVSRWRI